MSDSPAVHLGPDQREDLADAVRRGGGRLVDLADAEAVVWAGGASTFPDELPESVRWVQLPSAGIESWIDAGTIDTSRTWTSAVGAYSDVVAEHALALLLAGMRGVVGSSRASSWLPDEVGPPQSTLKGATVAIVGAGGIGRAMIPALTALGAEVVAVTRRGLPVDGAVETLPADRVSEVFDRADHVVLAAPATTETKALVGADELAAIGSSGWLVNIARGSLVDTDALVEALNDGTLGGAALDVTDPEPLPDGHPLWTARNALITPHVANPSHLQGGALADRVEENVRRFAAGDDLEGVVDLDRGY